MRRESIGADPDRSPRNRRVYSAVVTLLGLAVAYGYAFSNDVPAGSVRGKVVIAETGVPLANASVTLVPQEDDGAEYRVREAESGTDGRFTVPNLPAGSYQLSASSRAHGVQSALLMVEEGKPSQITLSLTRTQPDLALPQHQRVFATAEEVKLPVRGYVDSAAAQGQDRLAVTIYRTRLSRVVQTKAGDEALSSLESRWEYDNTFKGKALPAVLVNPPGGEKPALVSKSEIPITEGDREGFFYKRLPFGKLEPGLYLAEIGHGRLKTSTWMLVTDTALVTKQARGKLLVYAVDMTTGVPMPGATVRVIRAGSTVASGATDERGIAQLAVADPKQEERRIVVATRGADEAIVRNGGGYYNEAMGKYAVHAYTDRPIYRPGQLIQYKAIVRTVDDPGIRYGVPAAQRVQLELRDPDGDEVVRDSLTTNAYGSVAGRATLSPEARTGVYTLVMQVGGEKHTHDFVVASYKKPEYEVKVTTTLPHYVRGDSIEFTVSAEYYFGTPVAGASLEWNAYSRTDWSAEYPADYEYDEEEPGGYQAQRYYSNDRYMGASGNSGKVRLDENGKAVIRIPTKPDNGPDSPQAEIYTLYATVKDESNREVAAQGEAHVAAGDIRVSISPEGYVAEPGKPTTVTLTTRDLDGNPATNVPVRLESAFITWKDGERKDRPIQAVAVTTGADGKTVTTVTPPKAGEVTLTASATDRSGRKVYGHAFIWAAGDGESELDTEYADLSLLTDKRRYQGGESARVMVNTARVGQTVLLTVEGDRVYDVYQAPIRSKSTVMRVPIRADYGPNVLLAVCYVKDKHIAQSETILRVSQPDKEIKVEVTPDRTSSDRADGKPTYGPGDKIRYHLRTTDSQGHPVKAELSFGVVDESIYALREDDPAAIKDAFYPRRTNNVSTSYSFAVDYLGNASKAEPQITARKKFPDTAYWNPFLQTDSNGQASVSFELPDTLTTWRATATAQSLSTKVGRAVNKVLSTKPFLVRLETPRFLTQRDASQVMAIVHNDTGADQTVLLHLRVKGVDVRTAAEQTITIGNGKVGQFVWPVTAADIESASFDVSAWTPKTSSGTQFTDRVEKSVPIRPHGRERYEQYAGDLTPGKEEVETLRLEDGAVLGATRLRLRVTDSVRGAIAGALPFLVGYPYGCTEQTMSRVLPDLLAQRAAGISIKADEGGNLNEMLRDGLTRLSRMQHESGAWGWWEHDEDDPWMTSYVLYGLGVARQQGVPVNHKMIARAIEGGKKVLLKVGDRDKAFLLYALALADPKDGANTAGIVLQTLKPEQQSTAGVAYMVLLSRLVGQSPAASVAELDRRAIQESGLVHWPADGPEYSGWTERMNTAVAMRAYLSVDRNNNHVRPALHWLMMHRTGDYWESTRDTAWVLTGLIDYASAFSEGSGNPGTLTVSVNGKTVGADGVWKGGGDRDRVLAIPPAYLQQGKNEVRLLRTGGGGESFYSLELRKLVGQEGMGAETTAGIKVTRDYMRVLPKKAGTDYWTLQVERTNNRLKPGDRIRVILQIVVPKDLEYVMIEDPFPSGCEVTERGTADDDADWSYWYSSADIRDDRIAFFARRMSAGEHLITYNLRAQTPGSFHTLPTFVQPMYAPAVRGESAEARVEIK